MVVKARRTRLAGIRYARICDICIMGFDSKMYRKETTWEN
jgi:hypothetical protein